MDSHSSRLRFVTQAPGIVQRLAAVLVCFLAFGGASLIADANPGFQPSATERRLTEFERDVLPALTKAGCNAGRCHASLTRHGGFRLSPLGSRSTDDYISIVDGPGQMLINSERPEASLLLRKATGAVKHKGGALISVESTAHQSLMKWIAAGTPVSRKANPRPLRIEVRPSHIEAAPGVELQFRVRSVEVPEHVVDVTRRATFNVVPGIEVSGDVATVSRDGRVQIHQPGRCIVSIRYGSRHVAVPVTVPFGKPVKQEPSHSGHVIDRLLEKKWRRLGLVAADQCSDFRFIRRASLRLTGRLPTPAAIMRFSQSKVVDKRQLLIERLLQQPECDEYWATQWLSLFSIEEYDLSPKERAIFVEWLRESLRNDRSFMAIARDVLTAQGTPQSHGAIPFYRVKHSAELLAEATAHLTEGINARCFRCHSHPYADWQPDDYYALVASFVAVVRKSPDGRFGVYSDSSKTFRHPENARIVHPAVFGVRLPSKWRGDPRRAFVRVLETKRRRQFARRLVDWHWERLFSGSLSGAGQSDGELACQTPVHAELQQRLAQQLNQSGFDIKELLRTLCGSRAFGLDAESGNYRVASHSYFHIRNPRRLSPTVMLRAVEHATEVTFDRRARAEFSGYPRWFQPPRKSGPTCDRYREQNFNLSQALHLINSDLMQRVITHPRGRVARLSASDKTNREILDELMLCTMSRPADAQTIDVVKKFAAEKQKEGWPRRKVFEDVMWALINTKEFLFVD